MRKTIFTFLVALVLAASAIVAVQDSLGGPTEWTPDGLFYQARALELDGAERQDALERAFQDPSAAELRRRDPSHSGDPEWVAYNAQFYERRVLVPLAATAIEPVSGDRAILDLSLAGYVATVLAVFGLLLLRFPLPIAAGAALATVVLPALVHHSGFAQTDSWGLALETAALAAGVLALDRGPRWLVPWGVLALLLAFTRDSTWVLALAALGLALISRSRIAWAMFGIVVAATIPVMVAFPVPMRELLGQMLNDLQPAPDATWASIAADYPGAIVELLRANGGFVRDGAWYSAAYFMAGLLLLFALRGGRPADPAVTLLRAGAVAGALFVVVVPVFSAFRLELVWVPMAAFGLALGAERLSGALSARRRGRPEAVVSRRASRRSGIAVNAASRRLRSAR